MNYNIDFSVIIPHANSLRFLPKLLASIPQSNKIEIILIDNSSIPIKKEDITTDKAFTLLYSEPCRGAGGARNVGIEHASGKWLVFADADDYFTPDAFDSFYSQVNSDAEVVYFGMGGIYEDTGEISDRGDSFTLMVRNYLEQRIPEEQIRCCFVSPCSKMVRNSLVNKYKIRYHEVVASNDIYFNTKIGIYAKKIAAIDKVVYIATVSRGSLTKRRDFDAVFSCYLELLERNKLLKNKGLSKYQYSILYYFYVSAIRKPLKIFYLIFLMVSYRQNPFVGYKNWLTTIYKIRKVNKKESKYITR